MWILWIALPVKSICQTDWDRVVQPASVLIYKSSNSDPFLSLQSCNNLAFIDSSAIGISVENNYSIKGLSKLYLSGQFNTQNGGWGLHANLIGSEVFSEESVATSYGIKISKLFGVGLGVNFRREQLKGFSPLYIMMPQLGILYFFSKKMSVGFRIKKIFRPSFKNASWYKEIVSVNTGIGIQLDESIYLSVELSNQLRYKSNVDVYAEWTPTKMVKTFLMYQQANSELLGGVQYRVNKMNIGLGISNHNYLGNSAYLMFYYVL